jgi:hypothetical protein
MTQESVIDWRAEAFEDDKESSETLATKRSLTEASPLCWQIPNPVSIWNL